MPSAAGRLAGRRHSPAAEVADLFGYVDLRPPAGCCGPTHKADGTVTVLDEGDTERRQMVCKKVFVSATSQRGWDVNCQPNCQRTVHHGTILGCVTRTGSGLEHERFVLIRYVTV